MRRIRVIPSLLIQRGGLVKSVRFKQHKYVGDPINAVKIFNDKEVDEIVILDISASMEKRGPDFKMIGELTTEAFMPLAYGGGITHLDEVAQLIALGVEKIVLNLSAFSNPRLISDAAAFAGRQSVVVSIDVKKNLLGKRRVYTLGGTKDMGKDPVTFAKEVETLGAGEILLNAIDRDGTGSGYDLELIEKVSGAVSIPVVAVGGANSLQDFKTAVVHGASAVAAGSMFVFQGPHRAVLISYPQQKDLKEKLFSHLN